MNVFDCAIKREEQSRMSYEKLAAASIVPELKNLFTILAAAEQEHYDTLIELKKTNNSKQNRLNGMLEVACAFQPLLAKRDSLDDLNEDLDAYQLVIKDEEEGVRYYEELAKQTKDDGTRDILLMLATEERKHLNIIENIYSFVESPKNFLVNGEFGNLQNY